MQRFHCYLQYCNAHDSEDKKVTSMLLSKLCMLKLRRAGQRAANYACMTRTWRICRRMSCPIRMPTEGMTRRSCPTRRSCVASPPSNCSGGVWNSEPYEEVDIVSPTSKTLASFQFHACGLGSTDQFQKTHGKVHQGRSLSSHDHEEFKIELWQ